MGSTDRLAQETRYQTFDVICAGEPAWKLARLDEGPSGVRFESGVVNIASMLVRAGIRVGLAMVLDDDTFGRLSVQRIAATGIDVGGVKLAVPATSLVVVDAGGGQSGIVGERDIDRGPAIPAQWSSQVLLLSGLSPITSAAAALCKAARRARREGATVVLDVTANLRSWAGRDARTISMLFREADVVRASYTELAVLGMDLASVRKAMPPSGALVLNDPTGTIATGPFGEVKCVVGEGFRAEGAGDSCSAAICAEWARPRALGESPAGRWHRVLTGWASSRGASTRRKLH